MLFPSTAEREHIVKMRGAIKVVNQSFGRLAEHLLPNRDREGVGALFRNPLPNRDRKGVGALFRNPLPNRDRKGVGALFRNPLPNRDRKGVGALLNTTQRPQPPRVRRTAQMLQRLALNLPYPLARQPEVLRNLFQRMLAIEADSEPHPHYLLFARRKRLQHIRRLRANILL